MKSWLIWAVLALLTWGLWGLFPKMAVRSLTPASAIMFEALGAAFCGFAIFLLSNEKLQFESTGVMFAVATGITAILGGWFYLRAASMASISVVVVVTAFYPVVSVFLAVLFLGENLNSREILAVALGLAAILVNATAHG